MSQKATAGFAGRGRMATMALGWVVVCGPAAGTGLSCPDEHLCVQKRLTDDGHAEVVARNRGAWPLTVTLLMRNRSLPRTARRGSTRSIDPGGERLIKRFRLPQNLDLDDLRYYYAHTVGRVDARHDDDYLYRLPHAKDADFRLLQGYGSGFSHTGREHYTIDFDMPVGTPVYAARGGVVARVVEHNDRGCWEDHCGRYANYVVILHSDGTTGEYYHLRRNGALVEPGERVRRGQRIALSGNTGHTTMPHLHFGVYRAIDWGNTQSLPVRFETAAGIIDRPRAGRRYRVPARSAVAAPRGDGHDSG